VSAPDSGLRLVGVPDGSFVADAELVTATCAAPGKDRPAILALHPRAKAVCFCALAIIRLKRSFWHWIFTSGANYRERRPAELDSV
jgi:hypothetical protein